MVDRLAVLGCNCREMLSNHIVRYGEITVCVEILLSAARIALNHPANAQAAQTQGLGKIAEHGCMWESSCSTRLEAVINGVIHLIHHKLNAAVSTEIVQALHFRIG